MSRAPKKNISDILQDIRHPSISPRAKQRFKNPKIVFVKSESPPTPPPKRISGKIYSLSFLALFFIAAVFVFNVFDIKNEVFASAKKIREYLANAKTEFMNFNPGGAKVSFFEAGQELELIQKEAGRLKLFEISELFGIFEPALKEVPALFNNISRFSELAFKVSIVSEQLLNEGIRDAFNGNGQNLIKNIELLRVDIAALRELSVTLRNQTKMLADASKMVPIEEILGEDYLAMDVELMRIDELLSGILSILKGPGERHIVIFFQNPSEMRPSGGLIGSYADVVLRNGNIVNIDVRDIYDPDSQLDLKVVPPKQMQSVTARWGARDANWFFDFPTSAEKVLYFLEKSKMYSERLITFEGALAINANVIKDLLAITGPIEVTEYKLIIDSENFLLEIQEEVRAGKDRSIGQPKKILKTVAPALIKRLVALDEFQQKELLLKLRERVVKKDIQVYFRDKRLENFVLRSGAGGEVFQLPGGFFGDYLAVVNANIAGGKTDIFMEQTIDLASSIDSMGKIRNNLRVSRKHTGDTQKQSWYRELNQNFIKIFTPPSSKLNSMQGGSVKTIKPRIDYEKAGYTKDNDLERIESQGSKESGKTVFGTWFNVEAGKTKTLEVDYESDTAAPADGKVYQFVFEKQSGVNTSFRLSLEAPPGFHWQESNSSFYTYETKNPDGRIVINLTLVK